MLICVTLTACQGDGRKEAKKYPVSGAVTLDGKPLIEDGLIYFKNIAAGSIDTMNIKDGQYSGSSEAGDRRVEIYVFRVKTQDFNGMKSEVKENLIPDRYNVESTFSAKVTPEGPNKFDFEMTSK
jgi:hypothetical protein